MRSWHRIVSFAASWLILIVFLFQWRLTTRQLVVRSTTIASTEARALTTSPSGSSSAGRSVGGGREGASKQTNFMASYIHLDRHLGELEPQDIHTHGLWQAEAKKSALSQWSVKLQGLLICIFHNLFSIFPPPLNWHGDWCAGALKASLGSVANIRRRSSSSITTPSTEQVSWENTKKTWKMQQQQTQMQINK